MTMTMGAPPERQVPTWPPAAVSGDGVGADGPFSIDVVPAGERVTVVVRGDVDVASAPRLRRALANAARRYRTTVADLAGVTSMDAAGLGVLVHAADHTRAVGDLRLRQPSPPVVRMLRTAGLDQRIPTETPGSAPRSPAPRPRPWAGAGAAIGLPA